MAYPFLLTSAKLLKIRDICKWKSRNNEEIIKKIRSENKKTDVRSEM
jgi:hypothetical protein